MLKEVLNDALNNLHAESGALTSSAIVSIDGLPIVSVLERNIDSNRVGSLSAALLSLCGQTARLLSCGNFNQMTLQGQQGGVERRRCHPPHLPARHAQFEVRACSAFDREGRKLGNRDGLQGASCFCGPARGCNAQAAGVRAFRTCEWSGCGHSRQQLHAVGLGLLADGMWRRVRASDRRRRKAWLPISAGISTGAGAEPGLDAAFRLRATGARARCIRGGIARS